jgi:spoIIIJ-associated protein
MFEFSGKTYEEALEKALSELKKKYGNISLNDLIVEKISDNPTSILDIIKEKKTGNVFIRVKFKNDKSKKVEDTEQKFPPYVLEAYKIIENISNLLLADVELNIKTISNDYIIEISGNDKGMFIGKHGNTLNSLQNYVNFVINKKNPKEERNYVIIDSDGYRERRKKQLIDLALKTAKLVQQKGEPITLPPMLSFERKIIHMTLKDNQYVTTYSIGENPYKNVVVAPLLNSNNTIA